MSANNWTICPVCTNKEIERRIEERQYLDEQYGVVSMDKWLAMRQAVYSKEVPPEFTLREDYEIGIRDGFFNMKYTGYCNVCEFHYTRSIKDNDILEE